MRKVRLFLMLVWREDFLGGRISASAACFICRVPSVWNDNGICEVAQMKCRFCKQRLTFWLMYWVSKDGSIICPKAAKHRPD